MKKLFLVVFFCVAAFINSYSQTKQESIKELFHLMQQDSTMDKMLKSMVKPLSIQMQSQIKDSTSRAHSKELQNLTMQTVKEISTKWINEDVVPLYDKYFSQNEINDFIAFYKSPSGQKLLKISPEIAKDMMMVMMQKYMPGIQKTIKAKAEELKKTETK
ncbi:MAG: DUF2059 domain-containing protein [Mariniphaga sp.]